MALLGDTELIRAVKACLSVYGDNNWISSKFADRIASAEIDDFLRLSSDDGVEQFSALCSLKVALLSPGLDGRLVAAFRAEVDQRLGLLAHQVAAQPEAPI